MLQANVFEAKNGLSGFVRMLETGQEDCIVIARRNKPVAKLTRYEVPRSSKRIGVAKGKVLYSEGWDSPEVNAEVEILFGGEA